MSSWWSSRPRDLWPTYLFRLESRISFALRAFGYRSSFWLAALDQFFDLQMFRQETRRQMGRYSFFLPISFLFSSLVSSSSTLACHLLAIISVLVIGSLVLAWNLSGDFSIFIGWQIFSLSLFLFHFSLRGGWPQDETSVLHLPANGELISMAPPSLGLCLPSVPLSLRSGLADLVSYDTTDSGLVDCSDPVS